GIGDGCAIDGHFVGTCIEQTLDVGNLAHTAAYGQRDEDLAGYGLDDGQNQVAVITAGCDIQKGELVCALIVVLARDLDRVTCVDQINEVDAFDNASSRDIKARNDAASQVGAHGISHQD